MIACTATGPHFSPFQDFCKSSVCSSDGALGLKDMLLLRGHAVRTRRRERKRLRLQRRVVHQIPGKWKIAERFPQRVTIIQSSSQRLSSIYGRRTTSSSISVRLTSFRVPWRRAGKHPLARASRNFTYKSQRRQEFLRLRLDLGICELTVSRR